MRNIKGENEFSLTQSYINVVPWFKRCLSGHRLRRFLSSHQLAVAFGVTWDSYFIVYTNGCFDYNRWTQQVATKEKPKTWSWMCFSRTVGIGILCKGKNERAWWEAFLTMLKQYSHLWERVWPSLTLETAILSSRGTYSLLSKQLILIYHQVALWGC